VSEASATDLSLAQRSPTYRGGLGPLGAVEPWKRETWFESWTWSWQSILLLYSYHSLIVCYSFRCFGWISYVVLKTSGMALYLHLQSFRKLRAI